MKCYYCDKESTETKFLFLKSDHWCSICGYHKRLCYDHRIVNRDYLIKSPRFNKECDFCPDCIEDREKYVNSINRINVLSSEKNIEYIGRIDTRKFFLEKHFVLWLLKYNAHDIGGDIISKVRFKEGYDYTMETQWETKRYSIWKGSCDVYKKIK